jgi:hypothetical protein
MDGFHGRTRAVLCCLEKVSFSIQKSNLVEVEYYCPWCRQPATSRMMFKHTRRRHDHKLRSGNETGGRSYTPTTQRQPRVIVALHYFFASPDPSPANGVRVNSPATTPTSITSPCLRPCPAMPPPHCHEPAAPWSQSHRCVTTSSSSFCSALAGSLGSAKARSPRSSSPPTSRRPTSTSSTPSACSSGLGRARSRPWCTTRRGSRSGTTSPWCTRCPRPASGSPTARPPSPTAPRRCGSRGRGSPSRPPSARSSGPRRRSGCQWPRSGSPDGALHGPRLHVPAPVRRVAGRRVRAVRWVHLAGVRRVLLQLIVSRWWWD